LVPVPLPVSIIVPVRNSSRTIEACLQALIDEVPADVREIIVIDNGSTDGTPDLVRRFPVQLHQSAQKWVAATRNEAARLARYDLLAFVDSDCVVQAPWLETLRRLLLEPTVGIVGCKYEIRRGSTWVERAWNAAHGIRRREPHDVEYVPGGNFAMRRAVFESVGGFDEAVETGEDMDLCQRVTTAGLRVVQTADMVCIHLGEPRTLAAIYRRNRWHGRGARLRYPNGRRSPVLLATLAFAASLGVVPASLVAGLRLHTWLLSPLVACPLLVPAVYAGRYARPPKLTHFGQLWPIYTAYFLGRTVALPAVAREAWRRSRTPGAARPAPTPSDS
jgi:GT2 family glycosyltransferase